MEYISRREALKYIGVLTGGLVFPRIVFANQDTKEHERIIKELNKEPKKILLARMVFGEGRSVSKSEKIVIGFTPINRVEKKIRGNHLNEVILAHKQYSCFNENDVNLKKLINPINYDLEGWVKCLRVAREVLKGKHDKSNFGPTHYHAKNIKKIPDWVPSMKEKLDSSGFKHQFYIEA